MARRLAEVDAALDLGTGGGEVLATADRRPPLLVATESWPPNRDRAQARLRPLGIWVAAVADDADLPFRSGSFDLIVSRHPVVTHWPEIARVVRPGGTYLSQQVGAGSMAELTDALMGPQPVGDARRPERAVAGAVAAGLEIVDLREATLRAEFYDVGAVVHFLRKVIWTVPGFTVDRYRPQLADLHAGMEERGPFVAHARRFLIEARRPGPG